jgi:mannitol/fructose-specific phosphotransferase system IIA component (Ntr-type)
VLFILGIGIAGRFLGAYVGARAIGQPSLHSRLIANAHIPGGEMQIIIGMLALEYGVISPTVYVAIVFGAIVTSVLSGPLMSHVLIRIERIDWLSYLPVDHVLPTLEPGSRNDAITTLCERASAATGVFSSDEITRAVLDRESEMSTALGDGIAFPHARMANLERPVVVFARAPGGVDWNSTDDKPAKLIFLILTPAKDPSVQLQILRGISQVLNVATTRSRLVECSQTPEILEILRKGQSGAASEKRKKGNRRG